MKSAASTLLTAAVVLAASGPVGAQPTEAQPTGAMPGFSTAGAAAERALEARFDTSLSASEISDRLKLMAAEPNQVGSPHDKANAEYTLQKFKEWGWDAHIEQFQILYPTPREQSLQLLGQQPFAATLTEPPIPGDATTYRQAGGLPAYLAYGGEGDVTAPLVYVNYGMPADYETLRRLGVEVKGKIVIARYGEGWRGLKPKLAFEHGAVGCIIYSDPADDGYAADDPYPKGPARPERGLQRGSVADSTLGSGDPLTPGYGAVEGAPRIDRATSPMILKIPAIPISWGDAVHFLEPLGGPVAPKSWRGALPITYHVGGAGPTARLVVRSNWNLAPIYDVIAVMPGAKTPDEWVIRGNHRDGWVFGAEDPLSGQTAMMEEAKALGALAKTGWKPDRTIVYASWDAEEPGVIGSTEWAETHDKDLQAKAVVYINSDNINRGFVRAEGSPSLQRAYDAVVGDIRDPETGVSLEARATARLRVAAEAPGASAEIKAAAKHAADGLTMSPPGSGSDYEVFVHHLAIASIDVGFGGEGESGGVYHSAYDTFEHYTRFGDPGLVYGVVLAKTAGRLVLRAADAPLDPFAFGPVAQSLEAQAQELRMLAKAQTEHATAVDTLLRDKAYALAADPTQSWGNPPPETVAPALDFQPLDAAIGRLKAAAEAFDAAAAHPGPDARLEAANHLLQGAEQSLGPPAGLPGRAWFRNLAYAPGVYTGYGTKTLPAIREPIEERRWSEAAAAIPLTAAAVDALAAKLTEATKLIAQ